MVKRLNVQPSKSSFAEILSLHQAPLEGSESPAVKTLKRRGKSADPDYIKLTTYIKRGTHLAVKKRLLDEGKEISELVEELMQSWLSGPALEKH